jgi:hypothetical protein
LHALVVSQGAQGFEQRLARSAMPVFSLVWFRLG